MPNYRRNGTLRKAERVVQDAMECFFSTLETERTDRKIHRSRNQARADVFDFIERFYNSKRRHSTIGYLSPIAFEIKGWAS